MVTFEQRRRALRHHRAATRVSSATSMAVWIGGFGAILLVLVGGMASLR